MFSATSIFLTILWLTGMGLNYSLLAFYSSSRGIKELNPVIEHVTAFLWPLTGAVCLFARATANTSWARRKAAQWSKELEQKNEQEQNQ